MGGLNRSGAAVTDSAQRAERCGAGAWDGVAMAGGGKCLGGIRAREGSGEQIAGLQVTLRKASLTAAAKQSQGLLFSKW